MNFSSVTTITLLVAFTVVGAYTLKRVLADPKIGSLPAWVEVREAK